MTPCSLKRPSLGFLVVEDDTVAAIDLECLLEDLGHRVVAAAVAPSMAERALREHRGDIDAAIFGATLVGLPSFRLARMLEAAGLPAVVSSAQSEQVVRALGFAQPCLRKPFRPIEVARVVGELAGTAVAPAA